MGKTFAAVRRQAPEIPRHSCPYIDAAQTHAKEAAQSLHLLASEYFGELEEIRAINNKLRIASRWWREEARKLAARLDALESPQSTKRRTKPRKRKTHRHGRR